MISDAMIESYYRNRWEFIYGYDPLDPPDYDDLDVVYEDEELDEDEEIDLPEEDDEI